MLLITSKADRTPLTKNLSKTLEGMELMLDKDLKINRTRNAIYTYGIQQTVRRRENLSLANKNPGNQCQQIQREINCPIYHLTANK